MTTDANTVNMKKPARAVAASRAYHHGDLRDALVDAGMRLLERRDSEQLSLREVARAVGVSATAVYRHFPHKDALMGAIAARGFAMMGQMQGEAARTRQGPEALVAVGVAYVRFALQNPAVFRLMFSCSPPQDLFSQDLAEQNEPLRLLREGVAALVPPGMPPEAGKALAVRAWALVHGLAVLLLDRMVDADDAMIEAILATTQIG